MLKPFLPALFILASAACWYACGSPGTPLDANTRQTIDSLSTVEIRLLRVELDSLCQLARNTQVPQMVDSIKAVRLREIQEQLKTIPR